MTAIGAFLNEESVCIGIGCLVVMHAVLRYGFLGGSTAIALVFCKTVLGAGGNGDILAELVEMYVGDRNYDLVNVIAALTVTYSDSSSLGGAGCILGAPGGKLVASERKIVVAVHYVNTVTKSAGVLGVSGI